MIRLHGLGMNELVSKLEQALFRRFKMILALEQGETNAYRLFCGEREGIAGLEVDRFDSFLIFYLSEEHASQIEAELPSLAHWYLKKLREVRGVYLKRFFVDRSSKPAGSESYSSAPLAGDLAPERIVIRENGNGYWVKPYAGYSVGIFLDQRDNRRYLAGKFAGRSVLNCFAYTGGFSVACAKVGCEVTSVDLSSKYLEWARDNFELNDLDPTRYQFVAADAFDILKTAARRKREFDLVILDPPTFSRNKKGKVFSVKKDLDRLVLAGASVLRPGGSLFFSTNYSQWQTKDLQTRIDKTLSVHLPVRFDKTPPVPEDFHLQASLLASCLLAIG